MIQSNSPREPTWTVKEKIDLNLAIKHLLQIGAVSICSPSKDQFISKIFLVPKSDGTSRLVLNLKNLNEFINSNHFKLEDRKMAENITTKDCYIKSNQINLYFHNC